MSFLVEMKNPELPKHKAPSCNFAGFVPLVFFSVEHLCSSNLLFGDCDWWNVEQKRGKSAAGWNSGAVSLCG